MPKKAFVIMPYDKRFNRLYSFIIENTLKMKGYECVRQDMSPAGGNIMDRVIQNIAEADIAIVELSAWNWNVAYELGIRHALNRSGTILMCESTYQDEPKFDIKHLSILYYDADWLTNEGDDKIIAELSKLIDFREKNPATPDSPVHSCFQNFPERLISINSERSDDLGARIQELESENAKLRDRIEKAGLDDRSEQTADSYAATIMQAINERVYYGETAVSKLRELARSGDVQEFGKFLAEVLDHGFLDESDCRSVYFLCNRLQTPGMTRIFLEYATKQYPENEELNLFLAEELSLMPRMRDKAVVLANDTIGLSRRNGKYELTSKHVSLNSLAAFFNVYLRLRMYDEILKLSPALLDEYTTVKGQCMIQRNVVRAYVNLEILDKALTASKQLIEMNDEMDDNYSVVYSFFRAIDRYDKAYIALENCIRLDPKDEDYYYRMAGMIFDENMARTSIEEMPRKLSDADAKRCAVPFVLAALQLPGNERAKSERAVSFLRRNDCDDVIAALHSGKDPGYDMSMVEFALTKDLTPLFDDLEIPGSNG